MGAPVRILVYGVTGSGKSTLAEQIADALDLPCHLADEEVGWLSGWVQRPVAQQRRIVDHICAEDRWVLDTAYGTWRDLALRRVDVVVALDYPRWVSLSRLLRRTARRLRTKEVQCNGNVETWSQALSRDSILVWHFRSFARKRRRIRAWVSDAAGPPVVHLRSPRDTQRWLRAVKAAARGDGTPATRVSQNSRWSASSIPRSAS